MGGGQNFSISYSGGQDSNVVSALVDMAFPDNSIPRVYCDTGIELNAVKDFVKEKAKEDDRFIIIKPKTPIKKMLEEDGYPFKSKVHSVFVARYQKGGLSYKSVRAYMGIEDTLKGTPMYRPCPKKLLYQFSEENTLKISDMCCKRLKVEPLEKWQKENAKPYQITGLMRVEGGRRMHAQCLSFIGGKLKLFNPLAVISKEWEEWFIQTYEIKLPAIYYEPYNFKRTGCKGCPFARNLQQELDILKQYFPAEYKQCEIIWKPVYDEYRRIGYRLKQENDQLTF